MNFASKCALAALVIATASIQAGTITVVNLPATGADAATGISATNTYLCCLDFGNSAAVGSINGVPFEHLSFPDTSTVNSGAETNHGGTWNISANLNLASTSGGAVTAGSQADGSTAIMLTDLGYVASAAPANSWLAQEYGGLSARANYALRFYYRQWSTSGTRSINISFNGEGTNQAYSGNPLNEDAGGAHYIEYDFTAQSGDVYVYMTNLNNNESALIYGMSLQETAPPAQNVKPGISAQPVGITNWAGFSGSLNVTASGSPAPAYQWFQNGKAVTGDTNSLIAFSPLTATNAGSYYVIVTNVAGAVTSSVVTVDVWVGTNVISPTLSQVQLPATGTDAATGIGLGANTNYLCALAFAGSAFSGAVNGINFTPVNLTGSTQSGDDPNYGGTWTASTTDVNGFKDVTGGGASVSGQANGNMASVLAGASYLGVAPVATSATLNFGYLTPGANYFLRYYYRQWDAGDSPTRPVQFVFNGDGTNATFQTDEDIGGAYCIEYDFTAASNTVSLELTDESAVVNQGPMIYAITLQSAAPTSRAPVIQTQPVGGTNAPGASFDFSVVAAGAPPLAYQWYDNGAAIAGATNAMTGYGYLRLSDTGSYQVIVSNAYGTATSSVASLVVAGSIPAPPDFTQTDAALAAAASQADALSSGADTNQATTNWTAHWIGPAVSSTNLWLCYRKSFLLPAQPASAVARIAVDSKYWLWVNGQIAVREGELKREPNSNDTWYDEIDLAPLLQAGPNTIAVLQCYFGKTGFSHLSSGTAGFLFDMDADGTLIQSDTSWRMVTNTAFQLATVVPQPNYRLSESSLRYDMRLDLGDWTNADFDDSGWSAPTDWGPVGGPPWGKLWLRDLPFWQELPLQNFASTSVSGTNPAVWTCYLPVNEQFTPWLDVSNASGGQVITIVPDSVAVTASPGDEFVTTAGRQSFEFPGWISGNLVQFTVPAGVTVYGLEFRPHLANTQREGTFTCDNPFFNTLWDKAANTVGVNMQDTWGESRERANWIGDTSLILGQAPYAYDPEVELISRKCLLDLIHWQRSDDTLFAPAPANYKELPVQVLAALGEYGVLRYYRNTGDVALLEQCYPDIKSYLLEVWQTNANGLVIHRNGQWDWEDWGINIDEPLLDNVWYLLALNAAAEMAPLVGQPGDAASYLSRAQGILNQYNASFWTVYGYRSPTNTTFTDERGNAMAVLAGLTSPSQASVLRNVLMTNQNCSPYMEKYVLEALFKLGYPDDALARMQSRYSAMVANSCTTLWELFPATGGFNHGWSSGPLGLLDEDVAGITPTSPAFATFNVQPALGTTLNCADANVPSPNGVISVSAARDGADYRVSVRVPPGSSALAFQPANGGLLSGATLSIDGDSTAVMDDTASPSEINIIDGSATLVTNIQSTGTLDKTGPGTFYIGPAVSVSVGSFNVMAGQTILSGTLTIEGSATNQGTLSLLGDASLNATGSFINNGTLDIMTWSGVLPAGFVNNGVLLDRSAIKVESCAIEGGQFNLTIMGYAGHAYQLQTSISLNPATWLNTGPPQSGAGEILDFTDSEGLSASGRFYRVEVDPPF